MVIVITCFFTITQWYIGLWWFMAFRIFWAWDLNRFGMQFWCDLCGGRFHSWPTAVGYWIVDFLLVQSTFSFFTSSLNWLEIHVNPLALNIHWLIDSDFRRINPVWVGPVRFWTARLTHEAAEGRYGFGLLAIRACWDRSTWSTWAGRGASRGLFFGMGTGGQTKGENNIYIYII